MRGSPYPVELPLIPGTEAAGTVVTGVGAGVDPGLAGAPVVHFGHLCGVYAEMTAVPAEFVVPLPAGVALDDAAAVAMNGTTAYVLTAMACRIGPGDVVVVHAAAGATGGAVVQLAAAAGAEVIALASTAAKAEAAIARAPAAEQVDDPGRCVGHRRGGGFGITGGGAGDRDPALGQHWPASATGPPLSGLGPRAGRAYLGRAAEAHTRLASRTVAGKILLQAGSDGRS